MKEELTKPIFKRPDEFEVEPLRGDYGKSTPSVVPAAPRIFGAMKEELKKRVVNGPDAVEFEVDPLQDYY